MAEGFKRLGCQVDVYNYRTMAKLKGIEGMWNNFREFLIGRSYDLIVFCKVNGMHPMLLAEAQEVGPTWYWFMDPMKTAKHIDAASYAMCTTFASATGSDVADRFRMVNKNTSQIFEGFDPAIYFHEELRKIHNGVFIGNCTGQRMDEIFALRLMGVDVTIFGSGWPASFDANAPVRNEDERVEINQSKWVLNLPQDEVIFSDRVIKALGCGANVISKKCKDLVVFNGYVKTYTDAFEVTRLIQYLHNGEYGKRLAHMMAEDHSWQSVCANLLVIRDRRKGEQNVNL
jgi:hypothetical protein